MADEQVEPFCSHCGHSMGSHDARGCHDPEGQPDGPCWCRQTWPPGVRQTFPSQPIRSPLSTVVRVGYDFIDVRSRTKRNSVPTVAPPKAPPPAPRPRRNRVGHHNKPPPVVARPSCGCCQACGDYGDLVTCKQRVLCATCAAELVLGVIPPPEEITGRAFHVPAGTSLVRRQREPGTGEGNDYFGNHT